jgi:Glycerate kinase family
MPDREPAYRYGDGGSCASPTLRRSTGGVLMARASTDAAGERRPTTTLVATGPFGQLPAPQVAAAIARGLRAGGLPAPDLCPIVAGEAPRGDLRALLEALDFDARMRRSRAVVLGEWRLAERTLEGSAAFEIATRARQAGVPAYAVTAENELNPFDARILDLQVIVLAGSARALAAAGRRLAAVI